MRVRAISAAIACSFIASLSGAGGSAPVQITQSDGAQNDQFGYSVSISGDALIVGAPYDTIGATTYQGSATVFKLVGGIWVQQAKLTASDGQPFDYFGSSVAISGDTVVVGAPLDNIVSNSDQGSAYIFVRSGNVWSQQAKLTATDGAASDRFGNAVGISGNSVIVGASFDNVGAIVDQGSAYIFTRAGTVWSQQARLSASDGVANDIFAFSVAIDGDVAVAGVPYDNIGTNLSPGSAYVFARTGTAWTQHAKLLASDGSDSDSFGYSVAVSADTIIVGAMNDQTATGLGSAYVFARDGATWPEQAHLFAPASFLRPAPLGDRGAAAAGDFGGSVAISGDTAIVGAANRDIGTNVAQGAACVYSRSGSDWTFFSTFKAPDGTHYDNLGYAVGVSGDTTVIGVCGDDIGVKVNQGSAWVYNLCPIDLNADGIVDDSDFVFFVGAYNLLDCADPGMPAGCPADFNNDGIVEDADFVAFAAAYNTLLCP